MKLERRFSNCSNGSWSTSSPGFSKTETSLAGNSTARQVIHVYTTNYCYRLRVYAKGQFADSPTVTSDPYDY